MRQLRAGLGFTGPSAIFPGWRPVRWGPQKMWYRHHWFYEAAKQQRMARLASMDVDGDTGQAPPPRTPAPPVRPEIDGPEAPLCGVGKSPVLKMTDAQWRGQQLGVDWPVSTDITRDTIEALLKNPALTNGNAHVFEEQTLQMGSFMLFGAMSPAADSGVP